MKKIIYILFTLILLSGCAQYNAVKATARDRGAHVADEVLKVALWELCQAATYGAIKRRFSDSADKANALRVICEGTQEADLVTDE